jgi:CheY-like chemotaxis protein
MNMGSQTILLVEDSEDDVFLMQRALQKAHLTFPLQIAADGQQALDYLAGHGKFTDRARHPVPALVFLDLKLPYVHGFEVLAWIRGNAALQNLPVVILTSSPEERDRKKAEQLGVSGYLVKPPTREMILEAVQCLSEPDGAAP